MKNPKLAQPSASLSLWLKRALWLAIGVGVLWALAWAVVPPLAKRQIEAQGSEALGRKLTIGAIDFKPWTLELTVSDIAVASADGAAAQLHIARVYVDAELESLLRLAPVIDTLTVDAPTVHIRHLGDGAYDFDDIVKRFAEQPASEPLRYALYNLTVNDGAVDIQLDRLHAVRKLHLSLPFLSNLDSKRDIKVAPRLVFDLNGSGFDSSAFGTPFAEVRQGEAHFKFSQVDMAPYLAYVPASLPVRLKAAVIDAEIQLGFVQSPKVAVTVGGAVKVSGLEVADAKGAPLLTVQSVQTVLADVRPLEQVVRLASVDVVAPQLRVTRDRAGQFTFATNLGAARAHSTGAAAPKGTEKPIAPAPWAFALDKFSLTQGSVQWVDDSVQPKAQLALADISLAAKAVAWPFAAAAASLEGSATVLPTGKPVTKPPARLSFKGEGTDKTGTAQLSLDDVALGLAAPYVAQFIEPTVVGVIDGEMSVAWAPDQLKLAVKRVAVRDFALQDGKTPSNEKSDKSDKSALPQFKLLELTDAQVDLPARAARVGKLLLRAPQALVQRDDQGQWAAERWLKTAPVSPAAQVALTDPAKPVKPAQPAKLAKEPAGWTLALGELAVDDGHLRLDDRSVGKRVRLEVSALKVQMKNLDLDGKKPVPLNVSARVKSGRTEPGSLIFNGSAMWAPVVVDGAVELVDIPAHAAAPYVANQLNIELLRADASFKGNVRYSATPAGAQVQVRGDAALEDFLANSATEELLSWKSLNVPGIALSLAPGAATKLDVREATLSDFFARIVVNPTGRINLQDLVKVDKTDTADPANAPEKSDPAALPATVAPASPPAVVRIGPVSLLNGRVLFTDNFIKPNYSADLTALNGKLSQFSSVAVDGAPLLADLDVRGKAEGTASLAITGKVNPLAKPLALDIKGQVRDLELPPLSPYAIKYAGYGIERGKLSVDVAYTVLPDGQLTASNNIILNQLAFGDKVDGAPNSLPVKLAVALLADRNGVIDINLPISGSLNDPQFRLGPVIWKVITNLVVKAISSPFSLLAGALGGGGGDELSAVDFAPGSSAVSAQARIGLDKVAKALADRPALAMTVVGMANLEAELDAIKTQRLQSLLLAEKRRRTVVDGKNAEELAPVDAAESAALLKSVYRRADITKPRNLVGLSKELPPSEMEALLKASMNVNEDAARDLALQRGVAVRDYLASKQLPAERLFLGAAKVTKSDGSSPSDWKPHAELNLTSR